LVYHATKEPGYIHSPDVADLHWLGPVARLALAQTEATAKTRSES
jgi:hypothetical protein